jgi:uncharacterized membrane-anchored protein YjiN (DUF445 family)
MNDKEKALRKMKLFATGLLVLMVAVYWISRVFESRYPFLKAVAAFSEAGTVGALADWFAVVALFRHPLHLPIPRTGVIPRNRDKIGNALARFIKEHFLSKEVLRQKIAGIDLVGLLSAWIADEKNSQKIAERLTEYIPPLLEQFLRDGGASGPRDREGADRAGQSAISLVVRTLTDPIRQSAFAQKLTEDLLSGLGKLVADREEPAPAGPGQREEGPAAPDGGASPYDHRPIARGDDTVDRLRRSVGQPLYRRMSALRERLFGRGRSREDLAEEADRIGQELTSHPRLRQYLPLVWKGLRERLIRDLAAADPDLVRQIAKALREVGRVVSSDENLRERANQWLRVWVADGVSDNRELLVLFISETVKQWDPEVTSRRIELQVGSDLQWIRINGTIVGGLAGLLIYFLSWALGGLR